MIGYVPTTMKYVQREPKTIREFWEHALDGDEKTELSLTEAFPVDAEDKKRLVTAMQWAGDHAKVTEMPNDPIPTIEIISLEIRAQGGRAWKALIHGTFYVDLREDVLLDALRNGEGVKNSELIGPFVWAVVGSQTKIVRVGSKLHKAVTDGGKRKALKEIKTLEIGGVYENRSENKYVFLGYVDTDVFELTNPEEVRRGSYSYWNRNQPAVAPVFKKTSVKKHQLWLSYYGELNLSRHYAIEIVKNKAVVVKAEQIELPDDIIEQARQVVMPMMSREMPNSSHYVTNLAHYASKCLMRKTGDPRPDVSELDPLLACVSATI